MIEKELLKICEELIAIPSVTTHKECFDVIDYVETLFNNTNYIVEKYVENNSPCLFIYQKTGYKYIFNGHLDVVPAKGELFIPKVSKNKLVGRGAFDMKAASGAMIHTFLRLDKDGIEHKWALMLVTDEEHGGENGTRYLLEEKNKRCDFFIAGEPTNFKINNAHKGVVWVEITETGKPAHAAMPWEGKNAITTLTTKMTNLIKKFPLPTKPAWKTTYNFSEIQGGGKGGNVVADFAKLFIDIRFIPSEGLQTVKNNLKKYFPNSKINITHTGTSMYTNKDSVYMKNFAKIYKQELNKNAEFFSVNYSSDSRFYSNKKIDCINFGPSGGCMHQDEEWVDLKSLQTYSDFLFSLVQKFK